MRDFLRFSFSNEFPEMERESEYHYSILELMATGIFIINMYHIEAGPHRSKVISAEKELGMELGMMTMKFAIIKNACLQVTSSHIQ